VQYINYIFVVIQIMWFAVIVSLHNIRKIHLKKSKEEMQDTTIRFHRKKEQSQEQKLREVVKT